MMLLFNAVLYMLVKYASSRGPHMFMCLMLILSGPVKLLFCSVLLLLGLDLL